MHQFDSIVAGSLDIAQSEVMKRKNVEIFPEHLLWGLIKNPQTFSSRQLKKYLPELEKALAALPVSSGNVNLESVRASSDLAAWITHSSSHAIQGGRKEVGERDLLRFIHQFVKSIAIDVKELAMANESEDGDDEVPSFLMNLNQLAEAGKLDPVIGRSQEIRAVMEILGRRGKNNPVLVGPAGVGKTAIVEGLADLIFKGKVPDMLRGKTVYSLSMGALMAGTKFRGEFEERLQKLLKFMKAQNGEAILFIDEIHQLVGAGKTDGAMDAANLLKPALARGDLHCIGATTPDEFQKYILADSALERRFRSVPVEAPSKEDAIEILLGLKEKQEIHHGVKISDEAIYQAVLLSDQYITNKNLPDKAIDLIDEAASALKLSAEAMPRELVELEAEIRSKLILAQVEKGEQENRALLQSVESMKKELAEGKRRWNEDVLALKRVSELKNKLDKMRFELENAERRQNYEEASRIKYSAIPELEKELVKYEHGSVLKTEHVAQVIARQTGIPLEKILQTKQEKVLELENYLKDRVYGQETVLHEIAQTLMAAHAGLTDPTRPLGSFMLKGPTGVGKTETVKAVAKFIFNDEKNIVRLDMSEYSEKHSVAKLIGAPAGYIGYDDGGVLTEAVRRHPYAVILFDEIEKAHPDFADILLQILDDGRLTDNRGRTIDFKNTIIFMTTNARDLEHSFKAEVLGRIDEILTYQHLNAAVVEKLLSKQVLMLNERLKSKRIRVELGNDLLKMLEQKGYVEEYGARPLQTVFNKMVVRPLSEKMIRGEIKEGATVKMDWSLSGGLTFL